MSPRKTVLFVARLLFVAEALLAAVYCLLAYLPFTFHQIHEGKLFPWLNAYAGYHPSIHLAFGGLLLAILLEHLRLGGAARRLAQGSLVLQFAPGLALVFHPVLSHLQNDSVSLLWALLAVLPLVALAVTDVAAAEGRIQWHDRSERQSTRLFLGACMAAIFAWAVYSAVVQYRRLLWFPSGDEWLSLGGSFVTQLLLFLLLFLLLEWLSALVVILNGSVRMEFWLSSLFQTVLACLFLLSVVTPAVGLRGFVAATASTVAGIVLGGLNASLALWLSTGQTASGGIALSLAALRLGLRGAPQAAWALPATGGALGALSISAATMDWNNLLQMTAAALLWSMGFAICYSLIGRAAKSSGWVWAAVLLVAMGGYKALESAPLQPHVKLDVRAGYDASLQLAQKILAPAPRAHQDFYQFLSKNTNIARSVPVAPADLNLVEHLGPSSGKKPHVFIFTVDSLRRDYLSPYNDAVTFTPRILEFARDSVVFRNAFTRYGGTGLSEPSIWVGGAMFHKQYIKPFAPMNTLEKLLLAEGYQQFISQDEVLSAILAPQPNTIQLDPPGETMRLDFTRTLERLTATLRQRGPGAQPVFAYSQPQNIHVSVIGREGAKALDAVSYGRFYPPYASRLKRMDQAFGKFVDFLKTAGLYDDSIIILTADHGDSLGEDGRWGHAYTIFPEVVRIPLLIHLPKWLRQGVTFDEKRLAFPTDLSPTLYYLLGHPPTLHSPLVGSSLFTNAADQDAGREAGRYLITSSYAPVYGMLSRNGTELYISDAVNFKDYLFDLRGETPHDRPLGDATRQQQRGFIRESINAINQLYRFNSDAGAK